LSFDLQRNISCDTGVLMAGGIMPRYRTEAGVLLLVGLALSFAGSTLAGQEKSKAKEPKEIDAGIKISTQATARELGLLVYPGGRQHGDDRRTPPGRIWGF